MKLKMFISSTKLFFFQYNKVKYILVLKRFLKGLMEFLKIMYY